MKRRVFLLILLIFTTSCTPKYIPLNMPDCPPPPPPIENVRVALVLGGGGFKGMAHVGVLEIFERHGIPIDLIVGTSVGSAIGALYADHPNAVDLKNKLMKVKKWEILDLSILNGLRSLFDLIAPIQGLYYENYLRKQLNSKEIEDLNIPLVVVTTDIINNEIYLIRSGPIVPAVHASSAVPPFFSPVKIYHRTLVDGGVLEPVPVTIAKKFNPKVIISIDIASKPETGGLSNMLNLTYKSISLYYYELSRLKCQCSDFDIHPNLEGLGLFDDDKKELLYERGLKN
ncbi:hypothetical protein RFI_17153 [Reticulomyxa filosa]|uniref:PNPLA domain-containing protein n=1 Tax=Reticulomyxa filosa TaxID=46433 RepID=X6N1W2_RETFI|nr:hypothetical protein RFI_17153 [Reticulomyxa filosa]|eukprot:ETO20066.1 hypothetical protein RFI_17153 [Reticulomyxa filosa]